MLLQGNRPRVLHWYHAGPMLFGDWGTSRLYVLGLAFAFMGQSSLWFMGAMSFLLIAVGWAYEVICRHFPDGGGVYSAARERSETLAVVGGLLLCADYVVTAALSALDAFHYLHLPHPEWWAAGGIALVGVINFFGPTKAGTLALVVALTTVVLTAIIGIAAVPHLQDAVVTRPTGGSWQSWSQFTAIILAISGVEAVANMTGIMVEPVTRTARRSIWPVMIEIVVLNLVLCVAMQAVPLAVLGNGDPALATTAHRDDMLKVLAEYYVGPVFAGVAGLAFAALLLSAVNTAVTDLVSIQFMMARDKELPGMFGGLNRWGMPVLPLLIGTVIPLVTVLLAPDVGILAELYAIGVVGAIAINVSACATNKRLGLKIHEQIGMLILAVLMIAIWVTIAYEKPRALVFAGSIVGIGLGARWLTRNYAKIGEWMLSPSGFPLEVPLEPAIALPAIMPRAPISEAHSQEPRLVALPRPAPAKRVMVASRGNPKLLRFACEYARSQNAELWVIFVRYIAVDVGPARASDLAADNEAQRLNQQAEQLAAEFGIPWRFVYATTADIAETILDIAATHSVDVLILGASRRGALWKVMKGDVIQKVAELLPESINLLIQA
ncbi:MAG: amino acid permease [Planctomycetaceae bacterium]|nr:amino acid permease [Planctomycetaceae bacterium]